MRHIRFLIPLIGIVLFTGLYGCATVAYPGGSHADVTAPGFSWQHNYWCDLLSDPAKNGSANPARPIALTAMLVLCGALTVFWYSVPALFRLSRTGVRVVQGSGMASMLVSAFVFTPYHDAVINVASGLGAVALIGTFAGLYRSGQYNLLAMGGIATLLMGVNQFIYQTGRYLSTLPVVQKATFVVVLFWVVLLNGTAYRRLNKGQW